MEPALPIDRWGELAHQVELNAQQVARNRRESARGRHRVLAVAIFSLVCFMLLAWRSEVQATNLRHYAYYQCVNGNANSQALNSVLTAAIGSLRTRTDIDQETKDRYIAQYTAGESRTVSCGQR